MLEEINTINQIASLQGDEFGLLLAVGIFMSVVLLDVIFRGWALWRAARMEKKAWFIILLIVNSMAILPAIFLLVTKAEYQKWLSAKPK